MILSQFSSCVCNTFDESSKRKGKQINPCLDDEKLDSPYTSFGVKKPEPLGNLNNLCIHLFSGKVLSMCILCEYLCNERPCEV